MKILAGIIVGALVAIGVRVALEATGDDGTSGNTVTLLAKEIIRRSDARA